MLLAMLLSSLFAMKNQITQGGAEMGTHYITEDCINCGACDDVCPVDAISEVGEIHVIDQDLCTDCGACDDVCPVDVILIG